LTEEALIAEHSSQTPGPSQWHLGTHNRHSYRLSHDLYHGIRNMDVIHKACEWLVQLLSNVVVSGAGKPIVYI
jgi:hypothetical protein